MNRGESIARVLLALAVLLVALPVMFMVAEWVHRKIRFWRYRHRNRRLKKAGLWPPKHFQCRCDLRLSGHHVDEPLCSCPDVKVLPRRGDLVYRCAECGGVRKTVPGGLHQGDGCEGNEVGLG